MVAGPFITILFFRRNDNDSERSTVLVEYWRAT